MQLLERVVVEQLQLKEWTHFSFFFVCRSFRSLMCWNAALFSFTLEPSVLLNYVHRQWISLGNMVVLTFMERLPGSS